MVMMMMMMEGRDASRNLPDNPRRMREFHGLARAQRQQPVTAATGAPGDPS
jgi:hypothetical protein